MNRYVDIDKPVIVNVHNDATGKLIKMTMTIAELLAGTIEVLEEDIVRCKDCEHWEHDAIFSDGWCRWKGQGDPEWFCKNGRRRIEG